MSRKNKPSRIPSNKTASNQDPSLNSHTATVQIQHQEMSGPLPPPSMLSITTE